jgi:hypothetical protein
MTQKWRLWVHTACTASMARSAYDQLAAHWDKSEETPPTHLAWAFQQVGCGSTQIQPLPSNLTQGHQILHQAWLHLPTFQVSNGDGSVSKLYPNCIPTAWTGRTLTGHGSHLFATSENTRGLWEMFEMPLPILLHRTTSKHTSTQLYTSLLPRDFMVPIQTISSSYLITLRVFKHSPF